MAAACNYHPGNRATHHCDRCRRHFCPGCFPGVAANPAQWRERSLRCPICRRKLAACGPPPRVRALLARLRLLGRALFHPVPLLLLAGAAGAGFLLPESRRWLLLPAWAGALLVAGLFAALRRRRPQARVAPPRSGPGPGSARRRATATARQCWPG